MRGWLQVFGAVLVLHAILTIGMAALFGELDQRRSWRVATRLVKRVRRPRAVVVPLRRPIEDVGADLRRLQASFRRDGLRFAKYEACRQAYDKVLGEAADMVELAHLLEVLPPGTELDRERERVEMLLEDAGLLPRPWAA
ncbi:hypothetical protein J2X46_000776 [Nocardioides sp. BE266]|uniref:hypothetical protein n=1 Tax=Nocardioides sp. BE266 TaxID=2817725 RepID=UPI002861A80D|nr:hypothetical protein [Nocardioides sp. BE266]MDR7251804.1 hypothetical protein [Nocardioides sp. BE266]